MTVGSPLRMATMPGVGSPVLNKSQSLPCLPGVSPNSPPMPNADNRRKGTLSYTLSGAVDLQKQQLDEKTLASIRTQLGNSIRTAGQGILRTPEPKRKNLDDSPGSVPKNMRVPSNAPAWLKHDKQVLRFYGYFQETIGERKEENSRFRHCILMFYLEDGSISITEPKVENSGIPQGAFLKRHRAKMASGRAFGADSFKVGTELEVYDRIFKIVGCDRFTRWFYKTNDMPQPDDEEPPVDRFTEHQELTYKAEKGELPIPKSVVEGKQYNEIVLGGSRKNTKLEQFLLNDRYVLRFHAFWDDHSRYGARRYFIIHYFLSDNTVEIVNVHQRNSGRTEEPQFYKRGPLNKKNFVTVAPGMMEQDDKIYLPEDFIIGQEIDVWGRKLILHDCDEFTRTFYQQRMGFNQATIDVSEPQPEHLQLAFPPHTGIGSEEDSLGSCMQLAPTQPKKDYIKLMTLQGTILRFEARLDNGLFEDEIRRFIVAFYPADDTIAVFEFSTRNSGFGGGKFSERGMKKNPMTGKVFAYSDFAVGRTVHVKSHPFVLLRADEFTLCFMESNPSKFPLCDARLIVAKLAPLRKDPAAAGNVSPDDIRALAFERAGVDLEDQEIITLLRRFGAAEDDPVIKFPNIWMFLDEGMQSHGWEY